MKPYRGIHLAAAVLLAALTLAGCGDADKYAESGTITLTSDVSTVEVKSYVVFTVVSVPTTTTPATTPAQAKVILDECAMDLEFRSEGAGANQNWLDVPGTDATRVFKLLPRAIGTLNVLSRGKCVGSNEPWEYSAPVKVAVTGRALPVLTLTPNPTSVAKNNPVTFTLAATTPGTCDLGLSYEYSGAGFAGVTKVDPAHVGQFILTPSAVGDLTVTAKGWCTQDSSNVTTVTAKVTVTAVALPKVTSVIVTSNTDTIATGGIVTFTINVTADAACTVNRSHRYSGGGFGSTPIEVPSSPATFPLQPTAAIDLVVSASAFCTGNSAAIVTSADKTVTVTGGP